MRSQKAHTASAAIIPCLLLKSLQDFKSKQGIMAAHRKPNRNFKEQYAFKILGTQDFNKQVLRLIQIGESTKKSINGFLCAAKLRIGHVRSTRSCASFVFTT